MREANAKAEEASRKWNELSEYLNAKWANIDMLDRTRRRKDNVPLSGHFDTWHFWQREVLRLSALIQAEVLVKVALAEDDDGD